MDVVSQMKLLGGACSHRTIVDLCGKQAVEAALAARTVLRDARGRYALPDAHRGLRVANSVAGVLAWRSAAAYWGWGQKEERGLPEVIVPRNRHVTQKQRKVFVPHYVDLHDGEVVNGVTSKRRTLIDCFRNLPYSEAVAIGDSAVRDGDFSQDEVDAIAEATKGCGRRRIICLAEDVTPDAANPFESVLRAVANLVPGLHVQAQMPLDTGERTLHPDVGDPRLRAIAEAESFEFHGTREALSKDCVRYNLFTLRGWIVLRFSWEHVMKEPAYVFESLVRLADQCGRTFGHADVAVAA